MNPLCNDEVIRKAADWRAFKQGSDLRAAVASAEVTDTGWRGSVRDGPRPLKVVVIARSRTDIEVRCPCRDNQSTGAFCRHAVAVGLVLAAGESTTAAKPAATPAQPATESATESASPAYQIQFPPPWRRMLAEGRLAAKVTVVEDAPLPQDARLAAWLGERRAGGMIQLASVDSARFLDALAGHPRVTDDSGPVAIHGGGRIQVGAVTREGDQVKIDPATEPIIAIGPRWVRLGQTEISMLDADLPVDLVKLAAAKPVFLPLRTFLDRVSALGEVLDWPAKGWVDSLRFLPAAHEIEIDLESGTRGLTARPAVRYAGETAVPPVRGELRALPALEENDTVRVRDLQAERALVAILERHGFQPTGPDAASWHLTDDARIDDFLSETLPQLQEQYTVRHGTGMSRRMRDLAVVTPKFNIIGSGEDWLAFDLSFQTSDPSVLIESSDVWRMLKGGAAGKRKRIPKILSNVLDPLFEDLDLKQEQGRFVAKGPSVECIRNLFENDSKLLQTNQLSSVKFQIPRGFSGELRAYQTAGACWMIDRLKSYGGALLADDMGLGKTIQTIVSIEHLLENENSDDLSVLVVATTSLLGNWAAEFGKFAPGRRVRVLHGAGRDAQKEEVRGGEVWLTSFGTLGRDLAWYLRRDFLAVVVDEASLMRNPETDHARAVCKLRAANRIALTGTPIENGVRDLWSIFRFIQPGWLGGKREFQERYESAAMGGDPWALRRLRVKTAPFLLRRTKQEVAPELPAKIAIDEWCDLSAEQQSVMRELMVAGRRHVEHLEDSRNRGAARMQLLTTLLRMRQTCCDLALLGNDRLKHLPVAKRSAKLERLLEMLDEAVSGGHKVLVFSQFRTQLGLIRASLDARDMECLLLDGETVNRQALVDRFQSADGPPVFLISLKAGGYGLNLTAADVVIHFDPWWNPAVEAQATDRAHRIGQTRPVTVYRLLTRGTVEARVVALQARKRAVSSTIDEAGGGDATGWSERDLADLVGGL